MALSACFGGPIFALGMAFGLPTLLMGWFKQEPTQYKMSDALKMLYFALALLLTFMAVAIPCAYRWTFDRRGALSMAFMYIASHVFLLLL